MRSRRTSGFTLVEVVVVMAVIGFLALATAVVLEPAIDTWVLETPLNEAMESTSFSLERMSNEIAQLKDNTSVIVAEADEFEFTDVTDTVIHYLVAAGNLMRNDDILARDVQALTFAYYDVDHAVLAAPAVSPAETDLWRVEIDLTVERQGQIVTLNSQVHPRNLLRP